MDDEVRIPFILDVKDEGETAQLSTRLLKLRDAIKQINEMNKTQRQPGGRGVTDAKTVDSSI